MRNVQASFISSNLKKLTKWWCHKKGCLKLIRSFERLSQELFMPKFHYQNSTKWWCPQWLGLNSLKPRSFLGIIQKMSQTKFHQIRITKSKVIYVQIPLPKWNGKKQKKLKKFPRFQNGALRGLHIGAGQEGLQIGAALGISNWGKKNCKSGQWF